jgi:hypothetical protein
VRKGVNKMTRWKKSVTLKAIRENRVKGFDIGLIENNTGASYWNAQYLGDGTQDFFDTIEETQKWLIGWDEIGR